MKMLPAKTLILPALIAGGLSLAACGDDEPDVVVVDGSDAAPQAEAPDEGDSVSFSVGDDGVSFSSENSERDGGTNRVSVGEDGVSFESEEPN